MNKLGAFFTHKEYLEKCSTLNQGLKLSSNPRTALWCWRNIGGTLIVQETAFISYFLQKVSWVRANHFQPSVHLFERNLFTR